MDYVCEIIENTSAVNGPSDDKSTNEIAGTHCHREDDVGAIVTKIVELAYDTHTPFKTDPVNNGQESDGKINIDATNESDESFVVDCIEICTNESAASTAAISYEPSGAVEGTEGYEADSSGQKPNVATPKIISGEPFDMMQVNDKREEDTNVQKPIVDKTLTKSTSAVGESLKLDEFYSHNELHRRGYLMKIIGNVKCVRNLSLSSDTVHTSKVQCHGFPPDLTESKLIPMLERYGRILELRFVDRATTLINVTFMTDQEANNAIKQLNGRIVRGQPVKVETFVEKNELYVRQIPVEASKQQLLNHFNKLTQGLVSLFLLYAPDHPTFNRGYCYLTYIDYECALVAKNVILNSYYSGRRMYCDWSDRQTRVDMITNHRTFVTPPPYKLYMDNLRPGLTTSDLRKLFSVFGDVVEVDKNGNWASVKFRHPSETKRAIVRVDRKCLGNESVRISLSELTE
ncbi:heterogeneous nuclear ribonucleoprotein R-like isoform X2 [Bradysia coprophila]|uniref:heterogeneous nuclear ribonucleoprotein R-like isoform X2 n=1 Tax=Bradysia coprophila TaxID=38358 RepID=UPI00187D88E0|nr:heterogeneous nuclear ribonucleoprotein R-like isoform X2 [Bradysia coprophila]